MPGQGVDVGQADEGFDRGAGQVAAGALLSLGALRLPSAPDVPAGVVGADDPRHHLGSLRRRGSVRAGGVGGGHDASRAEQRRSRAAMVVWSSPSFPPGSTRRRSSRLTTTSPAPTLAPVGP